MTPTRPRLLVLMGSGETAPTMVTPHREVVARLGAAARAVLLDTPYGFQENAAEISRRAVEYFAQRVQLSTEVAGFPGALAVDPDLRAAQPSPAALARLRSADWVFAGPGSPTYALSAWRPSPVPEALAAKLAHGGAVVFASAAALTIGRYSVPVYEIYKVGQPLHWLDGLDLLDAFGFGAGCVVIPHFDNAEGGTHDTRFCYMGERRLRALEDMLPDHSWVLGIDEHTALVVDLAAREVSISGRGAVTVRQRGRSRRFAAGMRLSLDEVVAAARDVAARDPEAPIPGAAEDGASLPASGAGAAAPATSAGPAGRSPLLDEVLQLEQAFAGALATRRPSDAVEAILRLDRTILEWSADSLQSDDPDRARAVLHSLVHRLGEAASEGLRDPRQILAPLVDRLVALRTDLRAERAWALADRLRDRLLACGIELHDTPDGTHWALRE